MLESVLEFNKKFVEAKDYKPLITTSFPDKKIAVLACMDSRLVELLPAAIGCKNGDIKILKNAGGIISHPYGSVVRSLIVAIYKLGVEHIWIIGHTDCGMQGMDVSKLIDLMVKRGVNRSKIDEIAASGVDFEHWLGGFDCVESTVNESMDIIANHPLIPKDIKIEGLIMDSTTGKLTHIASAKRG